ncbi:trypsin-like peptidase domain-containing protein [Nocardioides ferulae]|uniref:trypsin-like peptidase domain-containing protein n=1 Tax=Nocardioides ferulae TaxID=2340821 RepID=UPI000EB34FB0|nr:trypsin-like peptidase domain-containing protein [Nocardioides ferulae]
MFGLQRGALAVVSTVTIVGQTVLGVGLAHADETPAPVTALERVNALVQPSIVYLQQDWSGYVYDKVNKQYLNGGMPFELTFQCTGFVVNPDGYIATAGHCVDQQEVFPVFVESAAQWAIDTGYYLADLTVEEIVGFNSFRIETMTKLNRADLMVRVGWGAAASGIDTAEVRRARVVDFERSDLGDVALLKVEADGLNALPLSEDDVETGTEVVSIGYPVSVDQVTDPDLTPSFKEGSVSSVKTVEGGLLTVYEISAAVSGGMSGGPTVDLEGNVVGVNSFGILGETQPFNFVRPSDQLRELMAGSGVANELSETTQTYRAGLAAYWAGDKTEAVELLETVVDDQPSNKLAADYLDRAGDLPDPAPEADAGGDSDEGGFPVLLVAIGGGAALLVVVLAGALVLVRRKRTPTATPTAVSQNVPTGGGVPPVAPRPTPEAIPPPVRGPVVTATPLPPPPSTPPNQTSAGGAATLAPPPPAGEHAPHFCGNCGDPVHPGEHFCENCGKPLEH